MCVHCFTGGEPELRALATAGFAIGFTGFLGMAKRAALTIAALGKVMAEGGLSLDRVLLGV